MRGQFLRDRIEATKAEIIAVEEAVTALTADGVASYTINTSQTQQTVTQLDLMRLNSMLSSLYNRLAVFETRLCGNGVHYGRPGF